MKLWILWPSVLAGFLWPSSGDGWREFFLVLPYEATNRSSMFSLYRLSKSGTSSSLLVREWEFQLPLGCHWYFLGVGVPCYCSPCFPSWAGGLLIAVVKSRLPNRPFLTSHHWGREWPSHYCLARVKVWTPHMVSVDMCREQTFAGAFFVCTCWCF